VARWGYGSGGVYRPQVVGRHPRPHHASIPAPGGGGAPQTITQVATAALVLADVNGAVNAKHEITQVATAALVLAAVNGTVGADHDITQTFEGGIVALGGASANPDNTVANSTEMTP